MISIIVPVYNSEKYLDRCILSIISQSYKNIEIILVNDGSKDSSKDICENWAKKDSRISVVNKENGGVSSARNCGISIAKGEYIQFVDSDDTIECNMCETLLNAMNSNKCDLVMCDKNWYNNGVLDISQNKTENDIFNANDKNKLFEYQKCYILHSPWNKLYKKEYIPLFNQSLNSGEDLIFNLDYISKIKNIKYIPNRLYNYFFETNNANHKVTVNSFIELNLFIEKQLQYYNGFNSAKKQILKTYAQSFICDIIDVCKNDKYANDFKIEILKKSRSLIQHSIVINVKSFIIYTLINMKLYKLLIKLLSTKK